MPFPDSPRVIYQQNPLEEVICQLRFPTILRIERDPAEYQERIRANYPNCEESRPETPELQLGAVPGAAVHQLTFSTGSTPYRFISEDSLWSITLAKEFVALSARRYERWEEFERRLREAVDILVDLYDPAYYSRIGLRYRDVIQRSKLDLQDSSWRDLLQPHIAGELLACEIDDRITDAARQLTVQLEPISRKVRIRHGLASSRESGEQVFVLDADFFIDVKTGVDDAFESLQYFNRQAGRLFRWCIQPRLNAAMGPAEPIAV
ncbi:MAG: TIGR04255 family protein [Planctomycetes bacterium]|nr:TIGR04255 family protein [Planctomycetota bacterium]